MYPVTFTYGGGSQQVSDASRHTLLLGFRVVPTLTGTQTLAEAMANCEVTFDLQTATGVPNGTGYFSGDQALPIKDTSTHRIGGAGNLRMTDGVVGQEYTIYILELGEDDIQPDSGPAGGGGSTPVVPSVETTEEDGLSINEVAPSSAEDGVDIETATALQVNVKAPGADTISVQGQLLAWGYLTSLWIRMPELDQDLTAIPAAQNTIALSPIDIALGGTTLKPSRIAYRPNGMDVSGVGKTVSLIYEVTTPQSPAQVLSDLPDPVGALGLNAATTAPPTLTTDGVDLAGLDALQMGAILPGGSTINKAGSLKAFYLPPGETTWGRMPDLDLPISLLSSYPTAYTGNATGREQSLLWAPRSIPVPAGRLAYRPASMATTGGATTVTLDYRVATVTGASASTPVTEAGLATPTAAAPTLSTQGEALTGASACLITVETDGTQTIDVNGQLAAYLYVLIGGSYSWVRAPYLDLTATIGGETKLSFPISIQVPTGRLAYRPSGLNLTGVGADTVSVTYQTAA